MALALILILFLLGVILGFVLHIHDHLVYLEAMLDKGSDFWGDDGKRE